MKTLQNVLLTLFALTMVTNSAWGIGNTKLRNICRVKGQETNTLRGVGLVVGLNGTGAANDEQTMRMLARSMEVMGSSVSQTGRIDDEVLRALRQVKNVAVVIVTATVPATGARRGDQLTCHVSAVNGKSLAGGRLVFASLMGGNTEEKRVFAQCHGAVQLDDPSQPMAGHVINGCQMLQDVYTPFHTEEGWVTFVLDASHADFVVATAVTDRIAQSYFDEYLSPDQVQDFEQNRHQYVATVDATNIRVLIPEIHRNDPVTFVADMLDKPISEVEPEARVIVNPRTGSIVISGDVDLGDVIISHRNLNIEIAAGDSFLPVSATKSNLPKLDSLVEALTNLKVPAQDKVEIIRQIHSSGRLHATLIVE